MNQTSFAGKYATRCATCYVKVEGRDHCDECRDNLLRRLLMEQKQLHYRKENGKHTWGTVQQLIIIGFGPMWLTNYVLTQPLRWPWELLFVVTLHAICLTRLAMKIQGKV